MTVLQSKMIEVTKEHQKLINDFSHNYFGQKFKYPSLKEIQKHVLKKSGKELPMFLLRKYRNKLPLISQFHPLNDTRKKNDKFSMLRVTTLGWVEVDLMFFQIHDSDHGQAFVAIDILSKMIYVESIPNKKLESLQAAINNMIKSPGFTSTKCILSDKEPAIQGLAKRNIFPKIRFITTSKKAKTVERAIRTIKVLLTKYLLQQGENSLQKWRNYIDAIVFHLNTRQIPGKIPGELDKVRPIDLNANNCGKYVEYLMLKNKPFFQSLHPVLNPLKNAERIFKFSLGEEVLLAKKVDTSDIRKLYWGETRSFAGHFAKKKINLEDNVFKIINRRLETSSSGHYIPVYDIEQNSVRFFHIYEMYLRKYPERKYIKNYM